MFRKALPALVTPLLLAVGMTFTAHAATVKSAKGSKALLNLDSGETLAIGDTLIVLDEGATEPRAVLSVTALRKRQAMVDVKSGEVKPGDSAHVGEPPAPAESKPAEAKADAPADAKPDAKPADAAPETPRSWSVHFGGGLDSETVKLTSATTVKLEGKSPMVRGSRSGQGFAVFKTVDWELGAGLEQLRALSGASNAACGSSGDCIYEVTALSPFARAGWSAWKQKRLSPSFRLGIDALVPIATNSTVIETKTFSPLVFLTAGAMLRWRLSATTSLPIAIDGAMYVGNSDVALYRVLVSVGYTWR